jgi:2-polyprenyl-6-methoxyphenol hydroxylase-like FAD-dependent oxidoreductase
LTAAKALAAHFEQVDVLDRDDLPEKPQPRQGAPQSRHTHVLLAGGQQALVTLFPGLDEELEREGAVRIKASSESRWERPGFDPFPQRDFGFHTLGLSRPFVEFTVRRRVEREANVRFYSRRRVVELVASADCAGVTGVRCEDADGRAETFAADLVVDASGRAAPTLSFFDSLGLAKPEETEIGIDQAYATAIFETPNDAPTGWKSLLHLPTAPQTSRGAFIFPIENGRWSVSLGTNHGDTPPGDVEGFMAFAKALRTTTVFDAIRGAKRLGEIARYSLPASTRRRFDRLETFPRGLILVGDSVCRFNPVFGQGMSVGAQEAVALARLLETRAGLADPLDGLGLAFLTEIQPLLESPWNTATTDFVYPKTRGDCPPDFQRRMQYGLALTRLAAEDAKVHKVLAEVNSLLRPQSALREPELASRVTAMMSAPA